MALRGFDQNEEKKSYGGVFLLGSALLVVVTLWSFWDDNITRRPWKKYQREFYQLDYQKAKAAYDEEEKKLRADPAYQELVRKVKALTQEEKKADVRFGELDQ